MFSLFRISEEELDKAIDRVLSNKRIEEFVEKILRRIMESVLDQLGAGLRDMDKESSNVLPP